MYRLTTKGWKPEMDQFWIKFWDVLVKLKRHFGLTNSIQNISISGVQFWILVLPNSLCLWYKHQTTNTTDVTISDRHCIPTPPPRTSARERARERGWSSTNGRVSLWFRFVSFRPEIFGLRTTERLSPDQSVQCNHSLTDLFNRPSLEFWIYCILQN